MNWPQNFFCCCDWREITRKLSNPTNPTAHYILVYSREMLGAKPISCWASSRYLHSWAGAHNSQPIQISYTTTSKSCGWAGRWLKSYIGVLGCCTVNHNLDSNDRPGPQILCTIRTVIRTQTKKAISRYSKGFGTRKLLMLIQYLRSLVPRVHHGFESG